MMLYICVNNEYCSEKIYKYLKNCEDKQIIIGLSDYDFESREKLFEHIFGSAIIVCDNSFETRADILWKYKPDKIVLQNDDFCFSSDESSYNV